MWADFPFYAETCLKILTKTGEIVPFALNRAQRHVHKVAQQQAAKRGFVRLLLPKSRQLGMSTYIEARYYWRTTMTKGTWAYVLTHLDEATKNLFSMTERFHKFCPTPYRPKADTANANEMSFGALESGFKVSTAGSKSAGRGGTIKLLHGSEVAYWPHALEHAAGVMQAVPKGRDQIGTEIFLESTSAGPGNYFHTMCKEAISGINEYELVFLPWFWEDGYVLPVGPKFRLDDDEMEVQRTFNLSLEQMAWRRSKIVDLKSVDRFYQEYPSTVTEAFQGVGGSSYIPMPLVDRARKCTDADPYGPVVFGLDVARGGGTGCDDSALCIREGRYIHAIERKHGWDTMEIANWVVAKSKIWRPRRIFVDVIGLGAGVVDRLHELGMPVTGVAGSEKAIDEAHYFNRRVEMYGEFRDWLKSSPVRIPDDDRLASDIVSVKLKRYDARGREQLMLKEDIKKDTGFSPDGADACALTFAAPVPMYAQESFEPGRQGMVAGESFEPEEA